MRATDIVRDLRKFATEAKAKKSAWFFKTGKGQYGYGDVFIGVTVPEQRIIAKKYFNLPFSEIKKLLQNKIHECRLTALLILVLQYEKGDLKLQEKIAKFYLARTSRINNWDLVDTSARSIVGEHLVSKNRAVLYKLVKSKSLWERRIAIIATHAFIVRHDFADTLKIAEMLFFDKEDLMHKAVGWMLREVGKKARPVLVSFLKTRAPQMPRTALRYAIEHFGESERKKYLSQKA